MPKDAFSDDDDHDKELRAGQKKFTEFDCPGCNANNPVDGFTDGSEVLCNYCGMEWEVRVGDDGRLKFREV
jgi:transcription elongation factor Elf1